MNSFDIILDHEMKLVKVTIAGELFQSDGEKVITAARETAAKYKYHILYDMRQATTTVQFASWYKLPRELEVFKIPEARQTKAAVVVSKTDKALNEYRFYETVTDNLGFKLRIFFEEEDAIRWLKENT